MMDLVIQISGRDHILRGYASLDEEIDAAFHTLLEAFLNDPAHDIGNLFSSLLPPFVKSMRGFFDRNAESSPLQDGFFNNLTFIWRVYLDSGRLGEAQSFWERILHETHLWEQSSQKRVHKGSVYYYWASTAILQGETDKGVFLMHTALSEDSLTLGEPFPKTPALMFVTLDFSDQRQFFYGYVEALADYLNGKFKDYRLARVSSFTIEDFRQRFLQAPPSMHAVFAFTHSLTRFMALDLLPYYALRSDFAAQYELNVIFDLVLVIDAAIKHMHPNPDTWRFIDLSEHLATQANLDTTREDLIFAKMAMDQDLDQTIADLTDAVFRFEDNKPRSKLGCDLCICYCLRNHAAHNLAAFPSIWARFEAISQSVFNVLLLCVDALYSSSA